MPIFTLCTCNHVDHVFCWVGTRRAWRIVSLKVFLDGRSVVPDVTEVDGLAALCEKQKSVELGEEQSGRLMNGNQDGLADVGKLAKESNGVESGLAVQTS